METNRVDAAGGNAGMLYPPRRRVFFFQFDLASVVAEYLQSPTPGPNLTTTAAIIEATAISAQDQWRLNLSETFDNNNYDWYVGTYDDEFAKTAYEVKDGKYHWTVTAHKGTIQWIQISPKSFSNFFMTMEVEAPNSLVNSDHGIIFRQDSDSNFYYFGITSEPGYFVSINHKEQWKMLIPYAKSPAIRSKGPNRLAILAQGTHFIFLINDQFVAELTNSQIETGKIALAIELYDANDQGNYQFDNIELRVPAPPATPTPTITLTPTIAPTPTITLTPHALIPAPADAKVFNEQFDFKQEKLGFILQW